jgi:hypothetical protein
VISSAAAVATARVARPTLRLAVVRAEIDATHPLEIGSWIFSRADLDSTAARKPWSISTLALSPTSNCRVVMDGIGAAVSQEW